MDESEECLKDLHAELVSKMTPDQQTVVDYFISENGRELIDTELPLSASNYCKNILEGETSQIRHAKNLLDNARTYHPIFDYQVNPQDCDVKAHATNFWMLPFDPYKEYEYLEKLKIASRDIRNTCTLAEVSNWYDLPSNERNRLSSVIEHVRFEGYVGGGKFNDKFFSHYRFECFFLYNSCGANLLPSEIIGSIFVHCIFNDIAFEGTTFTNCIFISCIFTGILLSGSNFVNCEFLDTELELSKEIIFSHCYAHVCKENSIGSIYYGERQIQPWDNPFISEHSIQSVDSNAFRGCVGIPTNADFLNTLDRDSKGFLCYKRVGLMTSYRKPDRWVIKNGSFITENIDTNFLIQCGRGVNVGNFFFALTQYKDCDLWMCRIRYEDAGDICVPWSSQGKFRASRVELLHEIKNWETILRITIREVEKYNTLHLIPELMDKVDIRYDYIYSEYIESSKQSKYPKRLKWWFE